MHAVMNDAVDEALSALGERAPGHGHDEADEFPQHDECIAVLTMKCGSPQLAVRKKLHEELLVPFIPDEGFAVFQTKVERHFVKIGPSYVQEKRAIYLKPSTNATQSKYLLLTKENFEPVLRMRWKVSKSMRTELKYEVFCYFVDTSSKKEKKRMSMKLLQQQQQLQQFQHEQALLADASSTNDLSGVGAATSNSFLSFGSAASVFPMVSAHSLSQAMQGYTEVAASLVESSSVVTKKSNASGTRSSTADVGLGDRPRKIPRGNRQPNGSTVAPGAASQLGDLSEDPPVFIPIPFRINGVELPLEVDVTALRRALGLLAPSRAAVASSQSQSRR